MAAGRCFSKQLCPGGCTGSLLHGSPSWQVTQGPGRTWEAVCVLSPVPGQVYQQGQRGKDSGEGESVQEKSDPSLFCIKSSYGLSVDTA